MLAPILEGGKDSDKVDSWVRLFEMNPFHILELASETEADGLEWDRWMGSQ